MFTYKLQSRDRRGNYTTVKSKNVESFSLAVAEKVMAIAKKAGLYTSFYLKGEEEVPDGWSSKELPYSIQIWLDVAVSEEDALNELDELNLEELPF